jgi:putative zinc finger/helix-turn-helix YgiT family protein
MRCPSCRNEDTLRPWSGTITLKGVEIATSGRRCSACGEELFDYEEVGRQEQALAAALVERGIRTGSEFALVRKAAGFKAVEVAELFGVRPETVSRWEHGEGEIPRTAAYALGELYKHPRLTRQSFEALAAARA